MAIDRQWASPPSWLSAPAANAVAVTSSDSQDLADVPRALYIGGAGDLKVTMLGGQTVIFVGVEAKIIFPIRVTRVWQNGTTATNIVALW